MPPSSTRSPFGFLSTYLGTHTVPSSLISRFTFNQLGSLGSQPCCIRGNQRIGPSTLPAKSWTISRMKAKPGWSSPKENLTLIGLRVTEVPTRHESLIHRRWSTICADKYRADALALAPLPDHMEHAPNSKRSWTFQRKAPVAQQHAMC